MDLLDLIQDAEHADAPPVVHAMLPNMWFACGGTPVRGCKCGCRDDYRPGKWVLRRTSTDDVTCPDCLTGMKETPWKT